MSVVFTIETKVLPEALIRLIHTDRVMIREDNGEVRLIPVNESEDTISRLCGSLASYPEISVEAYLTRKQNEKELER